MRVRSLGQSAVWGLETNGVPVSCPEIKGINLRDCIREGLFILDRERNLYPNPGKGVCHDQVTVIDKTPRIDPVFVSLTVIVCVPAFLSFSPVKICTSLSVVLNV